MKVVSASGLTQYFTVNTAVGYLSASDKRLLVGLGDDAAATLVEIRWPSGVVQTIRERQSRTDADRDRAGTMTTRRRDAMMTRRALLALLAARPRPAFGAGGLLARRQAAAARQAVRAVRSRALHRRRASRPA